MDIKSEIKQFIPCCEQEIEDKLFFFNFIDTFDDVLTRKNQFGHFTSSAFVINKERTKILLVYHNIYNGYIYPGGHADGEENLLEVALKEVEEETGVKPKVLNKNIFSFQSLPVRGHIKNSNYIPAHIHFDFAYLFEADENYKTTIKPDENKNVIWAPFTELGESIKLVDFFEPIWEKFKYYEKRINKPI